MKKKSPYNWVDLLCGLREAAGQGSYAISILATAVPGEANLSYIYVMPQLGCTKEVNTS